MSFSQPDPARSALLLMDFHTVIVQTCDRGSQAAATASRALMHARARGVSVFHVLPHNRAGYPELPAGPPFDDVRSHGLFREQRVGDGIVAELSALAHEPVVAKCRYSPFFANDLLHLLRMRGVNSLVLCGIATSGVVLSAVRDAWDLDYRLTVLADACADHDIAVHGLLLEHILPKQATVMTVDQWLCRTQIAEA